MTYEFAFTPLAASFAKSRTGVAAVTEQIRGELAELACDPLSIFFHVVTVSGTDFIVRQHPEIKGTLLVDTATFEAGNDGKPMEEGAFKGAIVRMPRGDSEE